MHTATIPRVDGRFFTAKEVADMMKISVSTVNRKIRRGELGYVQISDRIRRIPGESLSILVQEGLIYGAQAG
jgi:excisionase family DNA binding protein